MTVRTTAEGMIVLEGPCPSEDAETLLQHLTATPEATVDITRCGLIHAAVVQVLMALAPKFLGPPPDNPIWRWVYPQLISHK